VGGGKGVKGAKAKGGAVVTRHGTRVDGIRHHEQEAGPASK
jgi:hypothetical protein